MSKPCCGPSSVGPIYWRNRSAMKFLVSLLFVGSTVLLFGQSRLSTPMEIMAFMEASPTQYRIDQLYGPPPKRERPILANGNYIEVEDNREHLRDYTALETEGHKSLKAKALTLANRERPKYKKIRKLYQQILDDIPQHAQILTYMGDSYYRQKNWEKALLYFDQALAANPIDYVAQRLKAEVFLLQKDTAKAAQAIAKAHLLNRNNKLLLLRLREIWALNGQNYELAWGFDPKCYLEREADTVSIVADGVWLTYGMYKAVWSYEPDYQYIKSRQEVSDFLFHAELEGTLGTFLTYSALPEKDRRIEPALEAFAQALDADLLEEYVFYEVLLVDHPALAAHLTDEFAAKLLEYMQKVRSQDFGRD